MKCNGNYKLLSPKINFQNCFFVPSIRLFTKLSHFVWEFPLFLQGDLYCNVRIPAIYTIPYNF